MEMQRLGKSVRKVIQLQKDDAGNVIPVVLYKKSDRKRKVSPLLEPLDKAVRKVAASQVAFANSYVDRHNRSNQKRADGWVGDLATNIVEAGRNGAKKLRIDN